jgi:hypothetical protein
MAWWRTLLLSVATLILTFALGFSVLSLAFSKLTSEETLRPFVGTIAASQGASQETANAEFDRIYLAQYPCGGILGCVRSPPKEGLGVVLVSKTGHDFFAQMTGYTIVVALLAIVAILLAAETWGSRLRAVGVPAIISGLNIALKPVTQTAIMNGLPPDSVPFVTPLLNTVFSTFTFYYAIILGVGIVLTAVGYVIARRERKFAQTAMSGVAP